MNMGEHLFCAREEDGARCIGTDSECKNREPHGKKNLHRLLNCQECSVLLRCFRAAALDTICVHLSCVISVQKQKLISYEVRVP